MNILSQNKIKQIRGLHQKKNREEQGLFLVEGEKMVLEVLRNAPQLVRYCVLVEGFENELVKRTENYVCSAEELKKISTLTTPNKLIAVVEKLTFFSEEPSLILALDSVQDPGNLGTILRAADWFGIKKIICSKTTVDCYNTKVIQASMGSFLRVEVVYLDLLDYLAKTNLPIYGALLEGENVYHSKLETPGILLMGNEGNGISEELKQFISHPVTIPQFGSAESLNVAVATSILLSEFARRIN